MTRNVCWLVAISLPIASASVCVAQQVPDPTFKAFVEHPAYTDKHPRVLIDEGHFNVHTAGGSYKAFADLLTSDGFKVETTDKPFSAETLAGRDVLITANARGALRRSEKPAFTEAECDVVRDWVREGGSLLLVVDHYPTGHAAEMLAQRFDVNLSKGTTVDRANAPSGAAGGAILFSRDNKLLTDHAITRGRNDQERVNRVVTFTGQSLKGPADSVALLVFADTATDRLPNDAADGAAPAPRPARQRPTCRKSRRLAVRKLLSCGSVKGELWSSARRVNSRQARRTRTKRDGDELCRVRQSSMGHQYHALADGPDRLEQTWCTREGTSVRIDSSPRTREAQMRFCVFTIQRWISLAVIIVLVLIEVTAVTNVARGQCRVVGRWTGSGFGRRSEAHRTSRAAHAQGSTKPLLRAYDGGSRAPW